MEGKEHQRKTIKEWHSEERPREKMMQKGVDALTNAELLAILMRTGSQTQSAVDLAKEILALAHYDLNELARMSRKQMMVVNGIGDTKAITLLAALEIGRRKQSSGVRKRDKIMNSNHVFNVLQPILGDLPHEAFCVIYLNRGRHIIHKETISTGGIDATVVDIRMIMKNALKWQATEIIIGHNHPSGNLHPSKDDLRITKKLKRAADFFDITLSEHLIVSSEKFYSFADEGEL